MFEDVEADPEDFGQLCSDTLLVLTLFESLVETERAQRLRPSSSRPIARRLDEQRRMHPAIAQIVSDCFYGGKLSTNSQKEKEYRQGPPPLRSADANRLPETPIVFVDMPCVRGKYSYRGGDRSPPWSNPDEVEAALQVLALVGSVPPMTDGQDPASIAIRRSIISIYCVQMRATAIDPHPLRRLASTAALDAQ